MIACVLCVVFFLCVCVFYLWRWRCSPSHDTAPAFRVHAQEGVVVVEDKRSLDDTLRAAFGRLGLDAEVHEDPMGLAMGEKDAYFGGVHAIGRELGSGVLRGAADPRRDGTVSSFG
eukprot:TRINITY_DN5999_c0_g1_i2.p1 TRINITY_DN5999_c0_g1~~TRINITY_DN5999_c0_g1_i2.p1  ORF type:complete len:116 (-),score=27.99 TRINITY_DN5999_c0_g1_i2:34-381(-)